MTRSAKPTAIGTGQAMATARCNREDEKVEGAVCARLHVLLSYIGYLYVVANDP